MSELINRVNMAIVTDKMGLMRAAIDSVLSDAGAGRLAALGLESTILGFTDRYPIIDLTQAAGVVSDQSSTTWVSAALLQNMLTTLTQHCALRGPGVNAGISTLDSYAAYYNRDAPICTFHDMLYSPDFQDLFISITGRALAVNGVFGRQINDMGHFAIAGGYVAGTALDQTKYGMVTPQLVISGGGFTSPGPITVTVTGTNHAGTAAQSWTFTQAGPLGNGTYQFAETATRWIRSVSNIVVAGAGLGGAGTATVQGIQPRTPA